MSSPEGPAGTAPRRPGPETVELGRKLRNRFYEPLVLLFAATQACMHNLAPKAPEPTPDTSSMTLEQMFHNFMNKLAQICDTRSGGDTVTAVVALVLPGRDGGVQYRFASNRRNEGELAQLKDFVVDVLDTLRDWTEETSDLVEVRVLRKVIAFNRPRLQMYVRAVDFKSGICLGRPDLAPVVVEKLTELRRLASEANKADLDEAVFFQACAQLMGFIKRHLSKVNPILRDKANAEQHAGGQDCPWAELRHAMGRLRSYLEAAQILAEARAQPTWAALFYHPEVVTLPSSSPAFNPFCPTAGRNPACRRGGMAHLAGVGGNNGGGNGASSIKRPPTAAAILGRMASAEPDRRALPALRDDAEWLQRFGLDARIGEQCVRPTLRPIVHAEVLVHESLVAGRGPAAIGDDDADVRRLHVSRFFGGWRYIGASKPTCRLCEYYFAAVPGDGVRVRQGHRNLYLSWRTPDVYREPAREGEGEAGGGEGELVRGQTAVRRREVILNEVIKSVRSDTVRVLTDKIGERKPNDSNTSRTYNQLGLSVEYSSMAERKRGEDEDVDDTASMMGQLDLED